MLAAARKSEIKSLLLEHKSVSVFELAEKFQVTEETIRRDLKSLENEGVAERTHGGAILVEKVVTSFSRSAMKNILHPVKEAMARMAKPYVRNGLCLFLDSSTTVQCLVPQVEDLQLTVASNSVDIVTACTSHPNLNLIALGGVYNHRYRCFSGSISCGLLQNFYFDLAVISCRTLSINHGLTDSDTEEAELKRMAISRSKKVILLADHTKFDKVSFVKICDLSKISVLITDRPLSPVWLEYLNQHDIEVQIAPVPEAQP